MRRKGNRRYHPITITRRLKKRGKNRFTRGYNAKKSKRRF